MTNRTQTPATRISAIELFDLSEITGQYVNYGDATPEHHGGRWLLFDDAFDEFKLVMTTPLGEIEGYDDVIRSFDHPGDQYVVTYYAEWQDFIRRDGQFTTLAQATLQQNLNTDRTLTPLEIAQNHLICDHIADMIECLHPQWDESVMEQSYDAVLDAAEVQPRKER